MTNPAGAILVTGGTGTLGRLVVQRLTPGAQVRVLSRRSAPSGHDQVATQFHQLILRGCEVLARLPVLLVPAATSFQPIDAAEVAARLAELATGPPVGLVPDMGGPEIRGAGDLARSYLEVRGRHRVVLPVRLPGAAFAGFRTGHHLAPDHAVGRVTFAQFLAERFGPAMAAGDA